MSDKSYAHLVRYLLNQYAAGLTSKNDLYRSLRKARKNLEKNYAKQI